MPPAAGAFHPTTINPATGLATDYLNHFNEAIMLLDMLAHCPDLLEFPGLDADELSRPLRRLPPERDAIIAAYGDADPQRTPPSRRSRPR